MSDTNPGHASGPNLTIPDFLPHPTTAADTVDELVEFFNQPRIKRELHWFTRRETLLRAFERSDRELFYIRPQDSITAAVMVWCESRVLEPEQAQIRLIATAPNYRRRGFAHMLVHEAINFAQDNSKSKMIADVDATAPAATFWQHCGFEQKHEYQTDGGRTMLRMSRDI